VTVGPHLPFGLGDQRRRDAGSPGIRCDVHLLDLVVDHHHEPHDHPAGGCDGCVGDALDGAP